MCLRIFFVVFIFFYGIFSDVLQVIPELFADLVLSQDYSSVLLVLDTYDENYQENLLILDIISRENEFSENFQFFSGNFDELESILESYVSVPTSGLYLFTKNNKSFKYDGGLEDQSLLREFLLGKKGFENIRGDSLSDAGILKFANLHELNDSNFDVEIDQIGNDYIVFFYNDSEQQNRNFLIDFKVVSMAFGMKDKIKFGIFMTSNGRNPDISRKLNIPDPLAYPIIMRYDMRFEENRRIDAYTGGRNAFEFTNWIMDQRPELASRYKIAKRTAEKGFYSSVNESNIFQTVFIPNSAFLVYIYDCNEIISKDVENFLLEISKLLVDLKTANGHNIILVKFCAEGDIINLWKISNLPKFYAVGDFSKNPIAYETNVSVEDILKFLAIHNISNGKQTTNEGNSESLSEEDDIDIENIEL